MIRKNIDFFKNIDTEEKAYWCGFLLADGNLTSPTQKRKQSKYINLYLAEKDKEHVEKFANIFDKKIKKIINKNKKNNKEFSTYGISLGSKEMWKDLINIGIVFKKSLKPNIKIFNFINENLMHHFIRGYFDGDGCITYSVKNKYKEGIVNIKGSEVFCKKIQNIITKNLGLPKTKIFKTKNIFNLQIHGNCQLIKFKNWIYNNSTIFLKRKKDLFETLQTNVGKGSSKYRGVSFRKVNQKWEVSLVWKNKKYSLGSYLLEKDAAKAYNKKALELNVPKYWINILEEEL